MSRLAVQSLTSGTLELGVATADLGRDHRGLKHWSVCGRSSGVGPMPEDATVALGLADGRTLRGHAFLKNHRISSNASGTFTEYTYLGTGPLDGAQEYEFN